MVKLSQDSFLSKLSKFYPSKKDKGSVYVEIKRSKFYFFMHFKDFILEGKDKYKRNRK